MNYNSRLHESQNLGVVRGLGGVGPKLLLLEINNLRLLRRRGAHHINKNNDIVSNIIIMLATADDY